MDKTNNNTSSEQVGNIVSDIKGLSSAQAEKRIEKYGPNEIPEKEESLIHRIFRRFWGPIPWMIEAAAVLSALVNKWEDFIIIMVMLLVNAILDFYQESKALKEQKSHFQAMVIKEGNFLILLTPPLSPKSVDKSPDSRQSFFPH